MNVQQTLDKSAMGLSFLCLAHCLLLPSAIIFLPTLITLPLADERFHQWLLVAVVPLSLAAIMMGCRKHQDWLVMVWGGAGLGVLLLSGFWGHQLLGEVGERVGTVVGAILMVVGHYQNYRLCRAHRCECD